MAETSTAVDLTVSLGPLHCKNPIWVAAGTFLYGREYSRSFPLAELGAVCTKGTSLEPWAGNAGVRTAETPAGVLNTIGLQNPGIDHYLEREAGWLREQDATVVVNIVGKTVAEYAAAAAKLSPATADAVELNISCPNVKEGGAAFGTDVKATYAVVSAVRQQTTLPVIAKLSPNVTDITEFARAAEAAGADAVSVANCLTGMSIDIRRRRPVLGTVTGGLSGPAVRPIILRMVWQTVAAVRIPVVAIGGVVSWPDALEYLMAGARAVQVGSALFRNPRAPMEILSGMSQFLREEGVARVQDIIGCARV